MVGDLRTSSGCGEVWIGVPVQCYMECNIQVDFQTAEQYRKYRHTYPTTITEACDLE